MDRKTRLEVVRKSLGELQSDVVLLEKSWQQSLPPSDTIIKSIDLYLVPYYKVSGRSQILEMINNGKIDIENRQDLENIVKDLTSMSRHRGGQAQWFKHLVSSRSEGDIDYETLSCEIQWYVKPFYEMIGALDEIEDFAGPAPIEQPI